MAIVLIFSGVRKSRSLLTKTDVDALELLMDYLRKLPISVLLKELTGLMFEFFPTLLCHVVYSFHYFVECIMSRAMIYSVFLSEK